MICISCPALSRLDQSTGFAFLGLRKSGPWCAEELDACWQHSQPCQQRCRVQCGHRDIPAEAQPGQLLHLVFAVAWWFVAQPAPARRVQGCCEQKCWLHAASMLWARHERHAAHALLSKVPYPEDRLPVSSGKATVCISILVPSGCSSRTGQKHAGQETNSHLPAHDV